MLNPVTNQARDVTVVGIRHQDMFAQGPFYGAPGMKRMFGDQFVLTDAMIVASGDRSVVVDGLQEAGIDNGLQARDIPRTADAAFADISGIVNLFRSDLGIGIVVGVAGIGVVLVRSVRDRRRTIGTLRAMGFDSAEIGTSFLVEGAFVAAQGLLVGVGFGMLTVAALTKSGLINNIVGFQPPITAPPWSILVLTIALFIAALLASAMPARSASRIPPAVALRLVD
jgi:putative ABC transport system permease protein